LSGTGYEGMCIWYSQNGGPPQVWACAGGNSQSVTWTYVPKGGTTEFGLSPSQDAYIHLFPTIIVTGQ